MADDTQEEAKRRDDVLRKMLNTKPQPHKTKPKGDAAKKPKPAKEGQSKQ